MTEPLIAEIEGYASIFNVADLNGDIVAPGAFANSLKKKPKPAMLYSHAAEAPIGRWTFVREDSYGLFVKGELILSSPRALEVHALLEGGALDGLSIGYQTLRASRAKTGRRILEADLWEVSVVTFPMARAARVTRVGPARPEFDPAAVAKIFKEPVRVSPSLAAQETRTWRAPAPSSPMQGAGARLFAQTLTAAAQKLSH
ncbi:HK97 family phage prohead protease [Hyphococcus luteus]|uniref:HK97 family phage prohead protease n=1 Tax=Hyphococcus luteus TaxID=2058213 RepID=A0A2S7K412_9PROT|nr:HK97 family phage prohead protease [Marinicaulis flavus]PQA87237.1 HK97 family phage prohead protease [Marinicaulis flavus]